MRILFFFRKYFFLNNEVIFQLRLELVTQKIWYQFFLTDTKVWNATVINV